MRIYVAGLFEDGPTVIREAMTALREEGHTITHDWTVFPNDDQQQCAEQDAIGVLNADIVLAFLTNPTATYRGTVTECGIALGAKIPVIIITPSGNARPKANPDNPDARLPGYAGWVFFDHPHFVKVKTCDEAFKLVCKFQRAASHSLRFRSHRMLGTKTEQ